MQSTTHLPFKFHFVKEGQAGGLWAKSGTASADALDLDGEQIRYEDIAHTTCRDKRLMLALAPTAQLGAKTAKVFQKERFLVLDVQRGQARDLERHIDRFSSAISAERHRQELAAAGDESLYRVVTCPHCAATIDVSGLDRTRYVYCRYCESILDKGEGMVFLGDGYRVCGECRFFGRVQSYHEFNFYFLIIVYGVSYGRRYLCDACAVRQAKRALLRNFIFLLGVPSAVYMWVNAVSGRVPELKELAQANALARKGEAQQADAIYGRLLQRYPEHPGLLLNQSMGHLRGGEPLEGAGYLNRSLGACSNYLPAFQLVHRLQQGAEQSGTDAQ